MRTLVSIQQIATVNPIPGADVIEYITMENQGWSVVVKKGHFKPGDKCVYHQIDSLVPNISTYSFLAKGNNLKKSIIKSGEEVEGYRLKTVKLMGVISQGLALPLSDFPAIPQNCDVGTDVTQLLGVFKYDPPVPVHLSGELRGSYPGFLFVTDEDRMQQDTSILEKYKGLRFYITSKIDGTSSTFFKYENEFRVCGHKWEYKESNKNIFWRLAAQYNLKDRFPDGYGLQGETAGEGIQKNRIKLKGVDFYSFYVIDIKKSSYLSLDDMKLFVKDLGLKTVPIIDEHFILNHSVDELLKLADCPSPLNLDLPQEGIVLRLYDSPLKVSFKVISNAYLIKHGL